MDSNSTTVQYNSTVDSEPATEEPITAGMEAEDSTTTSDVTLDRAKRFVGDGTGSRGHSSSIIKFSVWSADLPKADV